MLGNDHPVRVYFVTTVTLTYFFLNNKHSSIAINLKIFCWTLAWNWAGCKDMWRQWIIHTQLCSITKQTDMLLFHVATANTILSLLTSYEPCLSEPALYSLQQHFSDITEQIKGHTQWHCT